ncbi:fumarylacetoacetate hydrolase family protein [Candidatus Sororendozoicomonas aggregata]|uniref:fumarylacetoacetate hydrolase family protein n=1 Tax=Candidatus Sororendozoicomonas aggregata TaxID=3073239 RepID=UPI002ED2C9B2
MKLASKKSLSPDGELVVVSRELTHMMPVPDIARTMRQAMDHWEQVLPALETVYNTLNEGGVTQSEPFNARQLTAPLPRATQFLDGSAYVNHVELARKARGAEMPESFWTDPLMYQGVSDNLLGPCEPIVGKEEWGIDFEAELAVITGDVPMDTSAANARPSIRLLTLCNDISYRRLIPNELAKGFGFLQSKPASAFGPVAVTPDEVSDHWRDGKLHLPMIVTLNGEPFGEPDCGTDMVFNFYELIAHAAKTRHLGAGTIIGSGTISNKNRSKGACCLVEKRMLEHLSGGKAITSWLRNRDTVTISMETEDQNTLFGSIDQKCRTLRNSV